MYTGLLVCVLVTCACVNAQPPLSQRVLQRLDQAINGETPQNDKLKKVAKLAKKLVNKSKLLDMTVTENGGEAYLVHKLYGGGFNGYQNYYASKLSKAINKNVSGKV